MTRAEPGIGQGSLFVVDSYPSPGVPPEFDLEKPMAIGHLLKVISDHVNLPEGYTTAEDLRRVEPPKIEAGLCFGTVEARQQDLKDVYMGIGFTATQYLRIARSPRDLAVHTYARTQRANDKRPDTERLGRDEAEATANRAAAHILQSYGLRIAEGINEFTEQRDYLLAMHKELQNPGWAHFKGTKLGEIIRVTSDIIHSDVEIAAVNLDWSGSMTEALQRAVHYNLYGWKGHSSKRISQWRQYVLMAGRHTKNQLIASQQAQRLTNKEFAKYADYLPVTG